MKIYISGKITGLPIEQSRAKFNYWESHISNHKIKAINPIKLKPLFSLKWWPAYMISDLWQLIRCDAILLQPDWKDSKGAKIELNVAKWFYLEVVEGHYPNNWVIENFADYY